MLELAEKGDVKSQRDLGTIYRDGLGAAKDEKVAFSWFQKAAEQGDKNAQREVGYAYLTGTGVYETPSLAFDWFRKSAEQGDATAECYVGYCYLKGVGVEKNPAEAIKWFKKSAEKGNLWAMVNLGFCYRDGSGTTANDEEALKWFSKAAEQNDVEAQYLLGIMYINGQGCAKNEKKGFDLIYKSAEKSQLNAQYNLAVLYLNGTGVEKNLAEALKWFKEAADQGDLEAMVRVADVHILGEGVPKDYDISLFYLNKAADANNAEAQRKLADCYRLGIGTRPNLQKAINNYRKAAAMGDKKAELELGRCLLQSTVLNTDSEMWMGNLQEGMAILQKLSFETIESQDKDKNLIIGLAAMEVGRFQQAKMALSQAGFRAGPLAAQIEPDKMRQSDFKNPRNNQIVCILGEDGDRIGSGFIYGKDGWVLTAAHVVAGGGKIAVSDGLQERWDVEGVLPGDFDSDLALLKTQIGDVSQPFPMASDLKIGETLYAVGYPLGTIIPVESEGILVEDDLIIDMPTIQMPILPGGSGSPVFNGSNELVGIAIESSYFPQGEEALRRQETTIVSYRKIKKLIEKAQKEKRFYDLKTVKEWSKKSQYWNTEKIASQNEYLLGLTLNSGAYEKKNREKALRMLEKSAESGNVAAQAELLKEAEKSGSMETSTKAKLMKGISQASPFYNAWTHSITSKRINPNKLLLFPWILLCVSGYVFIRMIKFIAAKKIPISIRLSAGILAFLTNLLICALGFIIFSMSVNRGYFTMTSLFSGLIVWFCLYFYTVSLINLSARGSKINIISLFAVIIILVSLGLNTIGKMSNLESQIQHGVLALIIVGLGFGLFTQFRPKARKFRHDSGNANLIAPRSVWICLSLLSAFILYLIIRGSLPRFSISPKAGVSTIAMLLGVVGFPCLLFYIGIKRGDGASLWMFRVLTVLLSMIMILFLVGAFLSPTTPAQKIEHMGLAVFLFGALGLSFSGQARTWLAGLKPAF